MLKVDKKEFMDKINEFANDEMNNDKEINLIEKKDFITKKVNSFDGVRVTLLNIKNFMSFNHKYGYDEGDVVIGIIDEYLKYKHSKNDFYVRYSGNEWLIVSFEDKIYAPNPIRYKEQIKIDCISGSSYVTEIKNLITELDRIRYFRRFYQVECKVIG